MFTKLTDSQEVFQSLCRFGDSFFARPVIVCIGSDRVTGDTFGPLTGEYLIRRFNADAFVYGNLSRPITALNLPQTARFIRLRHPGSPILAIDSALGSKQDIRSFRIFRGGLRPGAAVGKNLPAVGDVSLTATVAEAGSDALFGVRLGLIAPLAETAAHAVAQFLSLFPSAKLHYYSTARMLHNN